MKLVILDRDGVINEDSDTFVKNADEWIPIEGSIEVIARLHQAGFKVVVATNQSGIGRGLFGVSELESMHEKMHRLVKNAGGDIAGVFYCPHSPDEGCNCRKPKAGLIDSIETNLSTSALNATVIGDSLRDLQAGLARGCKPILVKTGKGLKTLNSLSTSPIAELKNMKVFDNLFAATTYLIAQPPLYKINKGKQHQYLKDEDALTNYLTQGALEQASLHVNEDAPGIGGENLEEMVTQYRSVISTIQRLSRLYPDELMREMIYIPRLAMEQLNDKAIVEQWTEKLQAAIGEGENGQSFTVTVTEDPERHLYLPMVKSTSHGVETNYVFNHEFFSSNDYRKITDLGERLSGLIEVGGYIKRGEKTQEITEFSEAIDWLMAQSEKGYTIQRYKGLGEMNPDQLWETTMDPEVRRMLRVTIEDAIAADQIFTTLMGDHVEPRRDFIEENALKVANLDF